MAMQVTDRETGEDLCREPAPYTFPEVRIDRKHVIQQQGRDFVLSDGLLDGLHQVSRGFFDVDTKVEQLPTPENGQTAVVSATVTVFAPGDGRVVRRASDIGDASPASVGRNIAPHLIRMASTRAVSRALRTLLNEGSVAYEELGGPDEAPPTASQKEPVRPSWGQRAGAAQEASSGAAPRPVAAPAPPETIQVDGRTFGRGAVLDVYHTRLTEAERAGLQLGPMGGLGGPPNADAPLAEIVRFSQSLKSRLEARAGAARASGK